MKKGKKIVMRIVDRSLSVGNSSLMNSHGSEERDALLCVHVCDSSIKRGRNMT